MNPQKRFNLIFFSTPVTGETIAYWVLVPPTQKQIFQKN